MGIMARQAVGNTVIATVGTALGAVNVLLLYPRLFGAEEYGLISLLQSMAGMILMVASVGLTHAVVKYFPVHRSEDGRHGGIFRWVGLMLLAGLVATGLLYLLLRQWLISPKETSGGLFAHYYPWAVPLAGLLALFSWLELFATVFLRTLSANFYREVLLRGLTALVLAAGLRWGMPIAVFIPLLVLVHAATALVLAAELGLLKPVPVRLLTPITLRSADQWQMVQFGAFAWLAGVAHLLAQQLDRFLVYRLKDLHEVAPYTMLAYLAATVALPARSYGRIARPLVAQAWAESDLPRLAQMYRRSAITQALPALLLWLGIWINAHNLLALLPDVPGLATGFGIFVWLGMAYALDAAFGINAIILGLSGRYRSDLYFSLLLIGLNVGLSFWFIPALGGTGAAVALAAAWVGVNLGRWLYLWRYYRLQPFGWGQLKLAAVCTATWAAGTFLPQLGSVWLDAPVRSLAATAVFSAGVMALRLAPEYLTTARAALTRIRQMVNRIKP